jgi:hypothetical protein
MWQEAGVVVVVGGAVYYLVRRFIGPRKSSKPSQSFVSLSELKRKRKP